MRHSFLNRRNFLKMMGFGATASALPSYSGFSTNLAAALRSDTKLNFVFILIDDLGWMDLGCYGSTFYETPNIDNLAGQGMRFTDAYAACPVCSPTRASIMTGKYPARLHLTDYIPNRPKRLPSTPPALLEPQFKPYLSQEEVTIAEALKPAGYTSIYIGKWHLNKGENPEDAKRQGFDKVVLNGHNQNDKNVSSFTDSAIEFIQENLDKPFFVYLSHHSVHTPLEAKKELVDKYNDKVTQLPPIQGPRFVLEGNPASPPEKRPGGMAEVRDEPDYRHGGRVRIRQTQDHPIYAGMVQSVDESVGRVLKTLDELDLTDNTVVIFTSDNGGYVSPNYLIGTSSLPLRAGKGWLYEGGIRIPLIIRWPGVVKPGSISTEPVISNDFYHTILEMANLPLVPEQHRDGVSLTPLLQQEGKLARKAIYWHWPHYSNHGRQSPGGAIRLGDYKLIEYYENNSVELFNLQKDIGETSNIAAQMPEKREELREMLRDWRKAVNAQMPILKSKE